MNKLIILLLIANFSFGQEIKYHNPTFDLKSGTQYLFGDDVKFTTAPKASSKVIELLQIGTKIEIIEKSNATVQYNGIDSPFYKVKYNNKIGYILGGLIALERKEFNTSSYFFTYKKSENKYALLIRHLNDGNEITESVSDLETEEFMVEVYDNKGLENVENIVFINYLAEACGVDGGGIYFFQTKEKLIKAFEIMQVSDAGAYWFIENLIFPTDENGREGKILYQKEQGKYIDEETDWVEINKVSRELQWVNAAILPKLTPEK